MRQKRRKQIFAFLLAGIMLFSAVPIDGLAAKRQYSEGLCEHHQEHTEQCGYQEEVPAAPCTHEHTADCYRLVEKCVHEHTKECYPEVSVSDNKAESQSKEPAEPEKESQSEEPEEPEKESQSEEPAEPEKESQSEEPTEPEKESQSEEPAEPEKESQPKEPAEPTECSHICSEESGCKTKEKVCPHESGRHTRDCGYREEIPAQPCSYICEECQAVEWPKAPKKLDKSAVSEEDGVQEQTYGQPVSEINAGELAKMRKQSQKAPVKEVDTLQIPENQVTSLVFIYINGDIYNGGHINAVEGDNFSYQVFWSPELEPDIMTWQEGSWFERTLFQVPGLNLASASKIPMSINGIKVGEYSLTYNKKSGEMKYKVVFNRYIQFFLPSTVLAEVRGSGKFVDTLENGGISDGDDSGTITIAPRPELPTVPTIPSGVGWQPSKAPAFQDNVYPFGKGVKWTSGNNAASVPQIEWRVVFLEQLQKQQREFMENTNWTPVESNENVIIKDTLDVNQRFYNPEKDSNRYGDAPFFFELPVVVPGTGTILNGTANIGNADYDGAGEIHSLFKGNQFKEIEGKTAATKEEINKIHEKVKETPLSWTVTTDPVTRRQTLLINAGKLGTTDPEKGITWSNSSSYKNWPAQGIQNKINECDNKITAIRSGQDSPIALLHQRSNTLLNLLNTAVNLTVNEDKKAELQQQLADWKKDYIDWYEDPSVSYLEPLAKQDANGNWVLIRALPREDLITKLENCVVDTKGKTLKQTTEYQNYMASLKNLQSDQRVYLENRLTYGEDWENAKAYYQKALEFYQYDGVYGFVVKVRTESVNTSMTKYNNTVNVELGDKNWSADDQSSITFAGGIIGSYNLGDIVLQKADAFYDTKNVISDIQKVEKDKAGLSGAKFNLYCGNQTDNPPPFIKDNLAHFLDKDASINGTTYYYTHTGEDHPGNFHGDIKELVTDSNGKIAASAIVPAHNHWLVEIEAPEGYYLDSAPIKVGSKGDVVNYQLLPNHSRSVLLRKADSFSKNPVEGAQFALFKVEGQKEVPVKAVNKSLNGHTTYWESNSGDTVLKTNEEGELCIHGLDAGEYVLQETAAAPGYITPASPRKYSFTLEEKLPETPGDAYDKEYHYLLTPDEPLQNEPDVARLELTKTGMNNALLEGAGFALFRFTGTEAQWAATPDQEQLWQPVELTNQKYFKTANKIEDVTLQGQYQWSEREVQAVITDQSGKFSLTDIPVGHYSIAEIKVPSAEYQRDYRSFYFTVDGDTVGKSVSLYTEPEETTLLKDNTLKNYKKQAKLALVKYDKEDTKPEIAGGELEKGWQYTEDVLAGDSADGLPGAVYKLFMRRGASTAGGLNPDKEQLKTTEMLQNKPGFDTCVAKGTTDNRGVLKLSDMKGFNDNKIDGLNPEEYYMIEVEAPKGYVLDQNPILFSLNEKVFENDADNPGLVMMADNAKLRYGLRLRKVDASTAGKDKEPVGLAGAEFTVEQAGTLLYFVGADGTYQLAEKTTPNAVSAITTGLEGRLTITGLAADTAYTFTETKAPRGYARSEQSFEMKTPKDQQNGVLEKDVLFPEQDMQVENERLKGKVTLHKQAVETGEALEDVEFTLYETVVTVIPPDDSAFDPTKPGATRSEDYVRQVKTTDKDGNITFDNLEWSPYYYIIETKAPKGYVLDQTKRMFSIDENSFDSSGQAIPIEFPAIINTKGVLGEARLIKTDMDDHSKRLEDAHFYLEKYLGRDAATNMEIWVGYGQGMYKTDKNGEINFLLPPGDYKLSEMKAPDGYLLEGMKEVFFTIKETTDGTPPPLVIIDEKDSDDGVVTNHKGETGYYLKKTIAGSNVPLPDAVFQIYWHHMSFEAGKPDAREDVYFISRGGGRYEYVADSTTPGATKELVTNSDGELYIMLPKGFWGNPPNPPTGLYMSFLMYEEVDAPEGIERPLKKGELPELMDNIYREVSVENTLKESVKNNLSISVYKTDGKSKLGLEGAEFELFTVLDVDSQKIELLLSKGVTGPGGHLAFEKGIDGNPVKLQLGGTYYVRETKAPEGYVLDETVHEITLDERHFDEIFQLKPIELLLQNYKVRGSVHLTKVSAEDITKGLPGAEFELLRKTEDAASVDTQWEHYGLERYITDEKGELLIENLPYGSYRLIERVAPLGYLLDNPAPVMEFEILENNAAVELGYVKNKVDPNPVRDVRVQKVAAENREKVLEGAEFKLYERKENGSYYLRQQQVYRTDSNGEFQIEKLPVGSYALKEIKAPAGYEVPKQDMTYFTVKVEERAVELQIENARTGDTEQEGNQTTSVTVEKVWEDSNSNTRPDSVKVQLYRNGEPYGSPVKLNGENNWKYTWKSLNPDDLWAVDEAEVPEGYEKLVSRRGNLWTITNRAASGEPNEPDNPNKPADPSGPEEPDNPNKPADPSGPGEPNEPDNPNKPADPSGPGEPNEPDYSPEAEEPGEPDNSDKPSEPSGPGEPGEPEQSISSAEQEKTEKPLDHVPQTGDNSNLSGWLLLMCLSAAGFVQVWRKRFS